MGKVFYDTIKNADGSPAEVVLNEQEKAKANYLAWVIKNALGYDIAITALTTIVKKVTEQKFYRIPPAEFVPIRIGQGAWSDQLVTYRDVEMGDQFETGFINTAEDDARLSSVTSGVDSIPVPIRSWVKMKQWNMVQLEQAAKAGNWDIVTSRARALKRNWDLGVQRIAFSGAAGANTAGIPASKQMLGLLNQELSSQWGTQVTVDTTTLTQTLSSLTGTLLSDFLQIILNKYQANCNYTAMPTHFVIPQDDFLGLGAQTSPTYPIKSVLEVLRDTLREMTENPNFEIRGSVYGMPANNPSGKHRYALYNYDEESIRMDIPVDFNNTLANTINGFQFQNVAVGQLTGVAIYRPLEMYYLQF